MKSIYIFFKSVKLAIVLILIIIVFAMLSTLLPQNKGEGFYRQKYQPLLADLVIASGLGHFSSSLVFFIPMGLFVLNLGTCTVDRLVRRARRGAARRFGPDLIHISLLILCVGGLVTASLRQEQYFTLGAGEAVALPGGYKMSLVSFESQKYEDGRPKAWISKVDVTINDKPRLKGFAIEVNHPLKLGILKVYQSSFGTEAVLHLADASGHITAVSTGQSIRVGDREFYFAGTKRTGDGPKDLKASIEEWKGQEKITAGEEGTGDALGPYRIDALYEREVTGLTAVRDPGFIPVLAALILACLGLALTTIQKKGRET